MARGPDLLLLVEVTGRPSSVPRLFDGDLGGSPISHGEGRDTRNRVPQLSLFEVGAYDALRDP